MVPFFIAVFSKTGPLSLCRIQALVEGAQELFQDGRSQEKVTEALISQLYRQIGQLTVERDFLHERYGP